MCRSIKKLRRPEQAVTHDELHGAALQFVRKISGFNKPSKTNQEAFDRAVSEIAEASGRLLAAVGEKSRAVHEDAQLEQSDAPYV